MSSSSTASSDEEIRIGNKLNSSVPNPSKQPANKIKVGNNPMLQKGIHNKDIQNILNKVNSRNKKTAQKKYEVMSSSDSEASSRTETVGKSNKSKESALNKPVSRDESDSESSDSVEEIKFPGPKIIKQEADLASYRPGVDLTDTTENMFPKPINIKKEPGIDESDRGKIKKSPGSKKRISNKQEDTAELTDDTKKTKKMQKDKEPSPRTRIPEIFMNGEHDEEDLENQPSNSEDDEKFVEKIEAAVEKKSKINVLQNVTISKPSTPKDQLSELHPNLERLQNKLDLDFADADLYLLMIPNSVDPFVLLNQHSIHQNCKIKVGKKYSLRSTGKTPDPCLVLSNNNKIIQFKDTIVMSQYIKKQKMPEIDVVPQEPVVMPENLKNRHPLFGSLFEEHIQLSGETQQKLQDAVRNKVTSNARKPKKKKEKKSKVIQEPESEEIIYDLLNYNKPSSVALASGSTKWKETTSVGKEMPSRAMDDSATKSSKKRKRNSHHAEHLEGQDMNENENVPTPNGRNKSNVKKELLTEYETDVEPPTKKRRKKSIVNELDHQESNKIDETFENAVQVLSKKTKAEIKRELLTEYETDVEPLTKKKKKKKKRSLDQNTSMKTNSLEPESNRVDNFDHVNEGIKRENIPKKSKNIKLEIFTEYETEAETSSPKRKKRKSKKFEHLSKSEISSMEMITDNETDISLKDHQKKKRKSKKLKSEPLTEYETDTERTSMITADMSIENDTNAETSRPKKKKKNSGNINNLKKEVLTEYETDAEVAVKKELMTEYETDVDSIFPSKKKRRKLKEEANRRSSLANSTLKTEVQQRPSFCPDVSYIREENFTQNDEDIDVIEDSIKIDFKRSKKIKKEKN